MKSIMAISLLFLVQLVLSQEKNTNLEGGVGIQGFDPVAYFRVGKAVEGKKNFSEMHDGVAYYFNSQENKQLFKKEPTKYLPAYGGWCAYAMANGDKVKIDPETFKIINGKLYLFYNFYFNNTLTKWEKDEANLKKQADQHWERFSK